MREHYAKIKEECVAKPLPCEEIKNCREAEIAVQKEAVSILEGEAVLLQEKNTTVRHTAPHAPLRK